MSDGAEIWFVRHAESEANASGIWQGQTESGLTAIGRDQIAALSRLGQNFDVIVSSPLERARATASAFGDPEISAEFIEIDLGHWEGKSWQELAATDLTELEALRRGEDVRFGGVGETVSELSSRVEIAVDRLFERLSPGGRAVVVTHGGVLDVLVEKAFGRVNGRRMAGFPENTSVTRIVRRFGRDRLVCFNDVSHLGRRPRAVDFALEANLPVLAIVRHGQTMANAEGRWQGQSDWGLDATGAAQAAALARSHHRFDRVVSSPLGRAWQTASHLHSDPEPEEHLAEIGFGLWEGLTGEEIRDGWPDLFDRIFLQGEDLARGETGETWAMLAARVRKAVDSIDPEPGKVTGVVTHGAAIRAYLGSLVEGDWRRAQSWDTPANASVTHLILDPKGPLLADYGTAGHLEGWGL